MESEAATASPVLHILDDSTRSGETETVKNYFPPSIPGEKRGEDFRSFCGIEPSSSDRASILEDGALRRSKRRRRAAKKASGSAEDASGLGAASANARVWSRWRLRKKKNAASQDNALEFLRNVVRMTGR
ncbi:hypothetical protein AXG93_638s1180 [Marchantia polymorpha subsp. ruderalis]|uniref:Uncharacterized protein n=1 Tax=Marchantia polymorpha subsp. ruderalis TaxID=1480154 RepID=A0A176W527_MARPO|nr:hypothetical protein AXG93_638s1180 [Marchantia polymorpha subsp. ruderalis]